MFIYVHNLLLLFIRGKILLSLSSKKKMDKRKHKKYKKLSKNEDNA